MIWGNLSTSRSFITSPKTFLLVRSIAGSQFSPHREAWGDSIENRELKFAARAALGIEFLG